MFFKSLEFFSIHIWLTPLLEWLVAQYLWRPVLIAVKIDVKSWDDKGLVVHLEDPAIKRCLYGHLCNLGVQYKVGRSQSSSLMDTPKDEYLKSSYKKDHAIETINAFSKSINKNIPGISFSAVKCRISYINRQFSPLKLPGIKPVWSN